MAESARTPPPSQPRRERARDELGSAVERKVPRRLRAERRGPLRVWFGLGTFGVVGWSVALPAVLGAALGYYVDHHWPSGFSWTLTLLTIGAAIGCVHAWLWIEKERRRE